MQGNLFVLPQYLLTTHFLSIALGAALASIWAFLQPLLTYYILFGHNLVKAYGYYINKIQVAFDTDETSIIGILLIPVAIKVLFAVIVSVWVYLINESGSNEVVDYVLKKAKSHKNAPKSLKTHSLVHDLTRPIFIISVILTSAYIYLNRDILAPTVWTYLRPFAVCIVLLQIGRSSYMVRYIDSQQDKVFFQVLKRVNLKLNAIEKY